MRIEAKYPTSHFLFHPWFKMNKVADEAWRGRSIAKEKRRRDRKQKYWHHSPPPRRIGNIKGPKHMCSFCNPSLCIRLFERDTLEDTIMDGIREAEEDRAGVCLDADM